MFETFGESHYIACSFQKTSSVTAHLATPDQPRGALLLPRHRRPLPGDLRDARPARRAPRDRVRPLPQPDPRGAGRPARRRALEARPRRLLRAAQGRADAPRALFRRLLARRRPPRGLQRVAPRPPSSAGTSASSLWKLNPLADWTERDVWNYIREHHLPYNPLHDQRLPVDRLHPLHQAGRAGRLAARRPLGGPRKDRVRDQLAAPDAPEPTPTNSLPRTDW